MNKFLFLFLLYSSICFSQEKTRPFSNPVETKSRFKNDVNLPEVENRKSFDKRIQNHFLKNFKVDFQDFSTIKNYKCFLTFYIDKFGNAKYDTIRVLKKGEILSKKFIRESKRVISLLPLFIPAKQRGITVKMKYVIPINNKYFIIK